MHLPLLLAWPSRPVPLHTLAISVDRAADITFFSLRVTKKHWFLLFCHGLLHITSSPTLKKNLSGNINLRAFNNQVPVHMLYVTHTKFDEDSIKLYGCHGKFYAISETKDHADMQCLKHGKKW